MLDRIKTWWAHIRIQWLQLQLKMGTRAGKYYSVVGGRLAIVKPEQKKKMFSALRGLRLSDPRGICKAQ